MDRNASYINYRDSKPLIHDKTKGKTMTDICNDSAVAGTAKPRIAILETLRQVFALRQQRLALRELEDYRLCDLGLTRDEVSAEADKPLWDVPAHWLR
jgi:uncharacterized protein YjiS (DUF1127 family)